MNTPWCGNSDDKLYLQSGQFTSTLKTSRAVGSIDLAPNGISWDGTDTPWCGGQANKLYLQSGQFTSTLKTSRDQTTIDTGVVDISWDGANTPWIGGEANKLYLQSGQFSSTIKDSQSVASTLNTGISYDGTNTPRSSYYKLYLQSGEFTATIKTSQAGIGTGWTYIQAVSWSGVDTLAAVRSEEYLDVYCKLFLLSGQFSWTVKDSVSVTSLESRITGICTDQVNARLGEDTTIAPTTLPPTSIPPTSLPPTSLPPTTSLTTAAPTTAGPTTIPPTSLPPTTLLTTAAPTTVGPTTLPPTTIPPTTPAPDPSLPSTIEPADPVPSVALSHGGKICVVNEESTCYWVLRFYDEYGNLDVPSHIWTKIDCLSTGIVIQAETLESTTSSIWTKTILPSHNRIIRSGSSDEKRILTVRARFDSNANKEVNEEFEWVVRNLQKVT